MVATSYGASEKPKAASDEKPVAAKKIDAKTETVKLDTGASKISWVGKKVAGSHHGTVAAKEGSFEVKNGVVSKGEVVVDLNTIADEDLTDAEYNKKLVTHLKSPDFFDVEKFPTATFKIDSFREVHNITPGEPNAIAKGMLTIRGITKRYEAKLFYTPSDTGFGVKGKIQIDRTQFGLKYNSKKFFDPKVLGDKLIDDKFEVNLDLVAKK